MEDLEVRGRVETIKTTAHLRTVGILRRILDTWENLLPLKLQRQKPSDKTNVDMHNPAPVLENNWHKLLWDFDIHTDHLISARRPDLIIMNKKKRSCKKGDFAVPADHRIKLKECEKKDK